MVSWSARSSSCRASYGAGRGASMRHDGESRGRDTRAKEARTGRPGWARMTVGGGAAVVVAQREQFEPADRAGWRQWLAGHHDTSPGVWLVLAPQGCRSAAAHARGRGRGGALFRMDRQHRAPTGRGSERVADHAAQGGRGTWSQTSKRRVTRLVEQALMTPAGPRVVERARSDGSWTLLDGIDAVRVPPDLAAAMAVDPVATEGFDAMTTSEKKSALWWIASTRRPATRLARIEETIRRAAAAERTRRDSSGTSRGPRERR